MDARDSKKHMGLLIISPLNISMPDILYFSPFFILKNGQSHIQGLMCQANTHTFTFLYARVKPTKSEAEDIRNCTRESEYVIGDLNLDPQEVDDEQKLVIIRGQDKISLLNEITTKQNKQLDHILGRITENRLVYATSLKNFISDHKVIIIRLSESYSKFISDPRLTDQEQR